MVKNLLSKKDLLFFLTQKELKARYKSAKLGFLWAFLNPLLQMIVLSIVFSLVLRIQVADYPLFLFSGLLPWTFFSLGLTNGTDSLINNRDLIKKVPFPREFLPLSAILAQLFHFILSLFIFLAILIILGRAFSINVIFLFLALILLTILVIGLSLLTSSLDIYFRDVSFIIQALVLVWFYLTPILYPLDFVPEKFILYYGINPLVGIISLFHSSLMARELPPLSVLLSSAIISFSLLIMGYQSSFVVLEPLYIS